MSFDYPLIGRKGPLFSSDIGIHEKELSKLVSYSSFLVIGGAGSIGSATVKEIFKRNPKVLHVVDINENNMVELVREIRSSFGYVDGEFATFIIDCGSDIFDSFMMKGQKYDYVLNFSALKHVRSEKDPFTLMRMIEVNILNTNKTILQSKKIDAHKYFCVSTDKAANPVNMMGASKHIMELFLMNRSLELSVSTARFANVAFSDGSLLYGFNRRIENEQPLAAPSDVRRYFLTLPESGELCLLSCLLGENRDIFFPKLDPDFNMINFSEIAERYLRTRGFEPVRCESEADARQMVKELKTQKKYPVYFSKGDTTGEKEFEEFYTEKENLNMNRFKTIGIIKNEPLFEDQKMDFFLKQVSMFRAHEEWSRSDIIDLFNFMLPEFNHRETGKFLDERM